MSLLSVATALRALRRRRLEGRRRTGATSHVQLQVIRFSLLMIESID